MDLRKEIIHKIMDRAIQIARTSKENCRDFRIMTSTEKKDTLILRWTQINIEDLDHPIQQYSYECFNLDGSSQNCSIHYQDQEEANIFLESLKTIHKQDYCVDHKC